MTFQNIAIVLLATVTLFATGCEGARTFRNSHASIWPFNKGGKTTHTAASPQMIDGADPFLASRSMPQQPTRRQPTYQERNQAIVQRTQPHFPQPHFPPQQFPQPQPTFVTQTADQIEIMPTSNWAPDPVNTDQPTGIQQAAYHRDSSVNDPIVESNPFAEQSSEQITEQQIIADPQQTVTVPSAWQPTN